MPIDYQRNKRVLTPTLRFKNISCLDHATCGAWKSMIWSQYRTPGRTIAYLMHGVIRMTKSIKDAARRNTSNLLIFDSSVGCFAVVDENSGSQLE